MVISKKKKQVRSFGESHKFSNIGVPCNEEGTYYGKVLKSYGTKFEVYVYKFDKVVDAKIRGSKQMRWKCPKYQLLKILM